MPDRWAFRIRSWIVGKSLEIGLFGALDQVRLDPAPQKVICPYFILNSAVRPSPASDPLTRKYLS